MKAKIAIGRKPTQQATTLKLQELEWTINLHAETHDIAATLEALSDQIQELIKGVIKK
jgi:hypothetical protein